MKDEATSDESVAIQLKEIATYIDSDHHRPRSGLRYRTPSEVRRTWEDGHRLHKTVA
jgi:hypothetical protein